MVFQSRSDRSLPTWPAPLSAKADATIEQAEVRRRTARNCGSAVGGNCGQPQPSRCR